MKRKDFEDAYDDFSCFSYAASARKSRRLDCELPPIIEDELDSGVQIVPDQGFLQENSHSGTVFVPKEASTAASLIPNDPSQELAIVLYDPANVAIQGLNKFPSSSYRSFVLSPELLSDWRSQMFGQGNQRRLTITELDEHSDEMNHIQSSNSMAVVPWVGASPPPRSTPAPRATMMTSEPMEEADAECETMETDEDHCISTPGYINEGSAMNQMRGGVVTLPPQQPHCLLPQYPPNTYTPIPW
uniref:Uncharacterized protein n=1 Tax=Kalanchoe fedtschenkoi TaxID=63787 RepID=A0A7N0U722_KALFE